MPTTRLYGLDIETDTTVDGLDPRLSRIVAVALALPGRTIVLTGDEATLLADLDAELGRLEPGVIVTWNGANFDLPFIADRAAACGVSLGLELQRELVAASLSRPLAGHAGPYRARWGTHGHLDGFRLYRADVGVCLPISCGLKSISRFIGLTPVEVDRTDIAALSPQELHDYVASDAELTRVLVGRRWPACATAVDRLVDDRQPVGAVSGS